MNVVFTVGWEVIVDDQGDLLDVDTTSQQISSDEDSAGAGAELTHNHITLLLVHVSMLQSNK